MTETIMDGHEEVRSSAGLGGDPGERTAPDSCGEGPRDATDHSYDGLELPADESWWLDMGRDELAAELLRDAGELDADTTLRPRVVIGDDDRRQIDSTTDFPWRCICSLLITADDAAGTELEGTGWLAGPSTVITAGHNVFLHDRGGWARSIEVIPGRDGIHNPHGSQHSTTFRSVSGWTKRRDRSFDYGAILLPPAGGGQASFGERLGFFGLARLSAGKLEQLKINLAGYPLTKPEGTLWWHARRLERVANRTLTYNIDTGRGQSGSPLWRTQGGARQAVGIHVFGRSSGNSAVRINQDVFDNLARWAQLP